MVERSLCMREVRGSKPRTSTFSFFFFPSFFRLFYFLFPCLLQFFIQFMFKSRLGYWHFNEGTCTLGNLYNTGGFGLMGCWSYVSVKSKLQHPPAPRTYPGHLTPLPSRGGGNLIIRVFHGVGKLNCTLDFK